MKNMLDFKRKKQDSQKLLQETPQQSKSSWIRRLRDGLKRTQDHLQSTLAKAILGKKTIDEELLRTLETALLLADIGVDATQHILDSLTKKVSRKVLKDPRLLLQALHIHLIQLLTPFSQPLNITKKPFVILVVGTNGTGKTTSIAKLAHFYQNQGKRVMLAAGDTFRAAAIDQLQILGKRNNVPVVAQHMGADSASVIYDAIQSAKSRGYDIVIADTSGRLHTQDHLMVELAKIKRVMAKFDPDAPHETLLILDAGTGQNALQQAQQFHNALTLNSIALTKLDGTAKGGIVFAITQTMRLPIRFIGVGEKMDDLQPLDAKQFVDALLTNRSAS